MSEKTVCKHNYNQCVPCLKKIVKAAKGMSEEATGSPKRGFLRW